MAGMLPGVELARKMRLHPQEEPPSSTRRRRNHPPPPPRERFPPTSAAAGALMDQAALRARQRLDQRFGHFYASHTHRLNAQRKEGIGCDHAGSEDTWLGSKLLRRPWHLTRNIGKLLERQACAGCSE